jgi:hypothetical protein
MLHRIPISSTARLRVNSFGLSTTAERLQAIAVLGFPITSRELETYPGMAGFLRSHVCKYAIAAKPKYLLLSEEIEIFACLRASILHFSA